MSGGGIGSALGSGLGLLLAPETGGLSMLIPAIGGAAGGALGAGLTGGNPLTSALMGGIGGGLTGAFTGGQGLGNLFGDSAEGVAGAQFDNAVGDSAFGLPGLDSVSNDAIQGTDMGLGDFGSGAASTAGSAASDAVKGAGGANDIVSYLKNKDKLAALSLAGNSLFAGADQLLNPPPKYNLAGNDANVKNLSGFNTPLPKYNLQNTASPYQGNWYTYGQAPQAPMYNAMPVPVAQKRGGLAGYAAGGAVMPDIGGGANVMSTGATGGQIAPQEIYNLLSTLKASSQPKPVQAPIQNPTQNPLNSAPMIKPPQFARGGLAMGGMPPSMGQPQMPMGQMSQPQMGQPNPLAAVQTAHKAGLIIGHALANHLKRGAQTPDGRVQGHGTGQSDSIPAKLSKDEYVIPSEVVSQLGDGSSEAGGKSLDDMVKKVRKHKTGNSKFPPKAHNPLKYLSSGAA